MAWRDRAKSARWRGAATGGRCRRQRTPPGAGEDSRSCAAPSGCANRPQRGRRRSRNGAPPTPSRIGATHGRKRPRSRRPRHSRRLCVSRLASRLLSATSLGLSDCPPCPIGRPLVRLLSLQYYRVDMLPRKDLATGAAGPPFPLPNSRLRTRQNRAKTTKGRRMKTPSPRSPIVRFARRPQGWRPGTVFPTDARRRRSRCRCRILPAASWRCTSFRAPILRLHTGR